MALTKCLSSVLGPAAMRMLHATPTAKLMDVPPSLPYYDVMLTDMNEDMLKKEIADMLEAKYLEPAPLSAIQWPVHGKYVLDTQRMLVNLVVRHRSKAVFVFFIVDTAAPATFLSEKACNALGMNDIMPSRFLLDIHGVEVGASMTPSSSDKCHFAGLNILGANFMRKANAAIVPDYEREAFQLTRATPALKVSSSYTWRERCA